MSHGKRKNIMKKAKLTICLVTYNGGKYLSACLASIKSQSLKDWRFLAIDNASKDDSAFLLRELLNKESRAEIMPTLEKNIGFTGGYNKLIKQAQSDYICLLNQDVILESDYLEKIINFMESHQQAGAGIGKILKLTNGDKTSNIDTVGLRITKDFRAVDMGAGEDDKGKFNKNEEVFGVSGCLPVYRKVALDEIGLLDDKFFAYKEDIDLAFRLYHGGWQSYRVGTAVAYHERGLVGNEKISDAEIALSRKNKSDLEKFLSYRNHWYLLIKNVCLCDWARYGVFILFYELKKIIFILLFEQKTLLAWADIFKNLPTLLKQRKNIKAQSVRKWIS